MGQALAPLYGDFAPILMSLGFFAAGITSAITAPMAAAFVVCECFGWRSNSFGYKSVALLVLACGVLFSSLQIKPIEVIRFAQITNGILLPVARILVHRGGINHLCILQHMDTYSLANEQTHSIYIQDVVTYRNF